MAGLLAKRLIRRRAEFFPLLDVNDVRCRIPYKSARFRFFAYDIESVPPKVIKLFKKRFQSATFFLAFCMVDVNLTWLKCCTFSASTRQLKIIDVRVRNHFIDATAVQLTLTYNFFISFGIRLHKNFFFWSLHLSSKFDLFLLLLTRFTTINLSELKWSKLK